jgi:hypothetical protein
MDLTPGEKAVLAQIGVLYKEAAGDQLVRALTAQWLSAHYGSYSTAYTALIEKGFIQSINAQKFRLTRIGLLAIGAVPMAPSEPARKVRPQPAPRPHPGRTTQARRSLMSRFVESVLGRR